MSKTEQLRRLIETIVRKEIKAVAPQIIREVMANLILEGGAPVVPNNSAKRRQITESQQTETGYEDYPTMTEKPFDRARMAELLGYGDGFDTTGNAGPLPVAPSGKQLIVSSALTELGTDVPVDPKKLPDHVVRALTRDYRDVMAQLNKKNG